MCIAGATGWAGRGLVDADFAADGLTLRSAVSRSADGSSLGTALGADRLDVPVLASVGDALDGVKCPDRLHDA